MAEQQGFTVWFTGLSGSGKSTIARLVAAELRERGLRVELLAGSEFRQNISQGLGFSREDRIANIRRIGYVAKLLTRNSVIAITTSISPYREARDECRRMIGDFIEVFVDCPLAVCEQRDTKGLYALAREGLITDFTGVSDPYEPPDNPELVLHSDADTAEQSAERVLQYLETNGWITRASSGALSPAEAALVKSRFRVLGDG